MRPADRNIVSVKVCGSGITVCLKDGLLMSRLRPFRRLGVCNVDDNVLKRERVFKGKIGYCLRLDDAC